MSRSKYKRQRSNRSAKIITTLFSIIVVASFILSLVGPEAFQGSDDPPPPPTIALPTPAPQSSSTPAPTDTPGVPTPVMVTPTTSS